MTFKHSASLAPSELPRVRVGIVTRNRAAILPRAIQSALDQDYPNLEIVVVDDASTDGTKSLQALFPRVRWTFNEQPRGYMDARNRMMQEPGADLFVSLDDDSWFLERDAIRIGVEIICATRAAAVAYDILDDRNSKSRERQGTMPVHTFIGCGHMLDLSKAREVGFYQPLPGSYGGEEKDLCLRLMDAGGRVLLLPGVHVWHDKTTTARDVLEQHQSGVCNDLVSCWQRCPLVWLPGLLLAKPLSHLLFAWRFGMMNEASLDKFQQSIRGSLGRWLFLKPALEGILEGIRFFPRILLNRRAVKFSTWRLFKRLNRGAH